MKLALDIKHDDKYYYIGNVRIDKNVVEKEYHSKKWDDELKKGHVHLIYHKWEIRKQVAKISAIHIEDGYIEIDPETIDDKYIDLFNGDHIVKISAIVNRQLLSNKPEYTHVNFTIKKMNRR